MKRISIVLAILILSIKVFAQVPDKISYQAVIRNNNNSLVKNTQIGIRISIIQGSSAGTVVYSETQTPTTNTNGLIGIEIGGGVVFNNIDWSSGPYFLKSETDPNGGTDYSIPGTSQLLSVPYALHSKTAERLTGQSSEIDPIFNSSVAKGITVTDTSRWNNGTVNFSEQDPEFNSSVASGITAIDTSRWNSVTVNYPEQDPEFNSSVASGITAIDTSRWNSTINNPETDPVFDSSAARGITAADTINWNNKLDRYTETQKLSDVISLNNSANGQIKNVTNPTDAQDAATKDYVDKLKEIIYSELLNAGLNGIIKDAEGNSYKTIKIGSQIWMADNLKSNSFNDGTVIPLVSDNTAWSGLTTPGYCWYMNDAATNANSYGALYNWYTVNTGNLCPVGWHVPSDADWTALTTFLGGETVSGAKLKETGTVHWNSPNTGATNESGFTGFPGGFRNNNGTYNYTGMYGYWWSATAFSATAAYYRIVHYDHIFVTRNNLNKTDGFSVRCLKD